MEDRHGQTQMTPLLTRTGRPQDYEVPSNIKTYIFVIQFLITIFQDSPLPTKKVLVEQGVGGSIQTIAVNTNQKPDKPAPEGETVL